MPNPASVEGQKASVPAVRSVPADLTVFSGRHPLTTWHSTEQDLWRNQWLMEPPCTSVIAYAGWWCLFISQNGVFFPFFSEDQSSPSLTIDLHNYTYIYIYILSLHVFLSHEIMVWFLSYSWGVDIFSISLPLAFKRKCSTTVYVFTSLVLSESSCQSES